MSKIESLLFMVGMVLSLGSVATFIVMNAAVGSSSDATLIKNQRLFVSGIARALTIPGVSVLLAATAIPASSWTHRLFADGWGLAQLVLAALIFLNTMVFIRPLVAEVSELAERGAVQRRPLQAYARRKALEDRFGAANCLMIVAVLLLAAFKP